MENDIEHAIDKGLRFLEQEQEADGSFLCLTSTVFDDYRAAKTVPAIVPSNIVLSSLARLGEDPRAASIRKKAAQFLIGERGSHWSFNYWFKNSKEYKDIPYPDDLDDTFCALAALYEYDKNIFDGEALGKIVTMLTAAEIEEGGPYNMWLVPKKGSKNDGGAWQDIDLVVNSNIAFFLSLQGISLPNVDAFIEASIDDEDYEFPYNTVYPGIYFVSRFYRGDRAPRIIKLLLSKRDSRGIWENPLRTALAVSALLNLSAGALHAQAQAGVAYLLKTQSASGGWAPYSFFFQMKLKEKTLYAGSAALTTALCLEAINAYEAARKKSEAGNMPENIAAEASPAAEKKMKIYEAVARRAKEKFSLLGSDLGKQGLRALAKTLAADTRKEIVLLPLYFRMSLGKAGAAISDEMLVLLGLANLYGWIAYTIYDDFLDTEGYAETLPVASVCLRESLRALDLALFGNPGFANFSRHVFDVIDGANSWEVANCRPRDMASFLASGKRRLPEYAHYEELANKSLGHALGPIAILFSLGYDGTTAEVRKTIAFFKHYLIARQLNDDAHDWQEDFRRGHLNAATVRLLEDMKGRPVNAARMEEVFWDRTIVKVSKDILQEIELAEKEIAELPLVDDPALLGDLLTPIRQSAKKAAHEQKETKKFMEAYTA